MLLHKPRPLFRRVNTRARGVSHDLGGDFAAQRQSKSLPRNRSGLGPMHGRTRRGLDYSPLFKFLLSQVGEDWTNVHREAVERLDREEPIYWMVARSDLEKRSVVRVGDNSCYSGLYIGKDNRLAFVDPEINEHDLNPACGCCTHTFNGRRFTRPYVWGAPSPTS